jgi:ATPase subunit of ABC transporter with duplicated ATPase domains
MANPQYVYVMNKLNKTYPGGKQVLKDVTLAFLPGAKIGVVGVNGAGKSTLLRIMAGEEKEFVGEGWAADGVTEEGQARPLQRARHELFRRDRR